jgi:hypothetical protein
METGTSHTHEHGYGADENIPKKEVITKEQPKRGMAQWKWDIKRDHLFERFSAKSESISAP